MSDVDTVVIGSGAGGLTAALALARSGERVLVLEQHYLPGGWCHSFPLDGYLFSPGVHYIGDLGPGELMRTMYEGLGVANDLAFLELDRDDYDHVRIGSESFSIPAGAEPYKARLRARFPAEADGIERFFRILEGSHDAGVAMLGARDLRSALGALKGTGPFVRWGLRSAGACLDAHFDDPFLKAILSIQAGNHGVAPRRVPMAVHATILGHYLNGGAYPMGGGRAIPRAFLKSLRAHGGRIQMRAEVRRIMVEVEQGRRVARGVVLADGTEIRCKRVVSNADPTVTFDRLVGPAHQSRLLKARLKRTTYGRSCVSLFVALDTDPRAFGMSSANVWYSPTADIDGQYAPVDRAADIGRDGLGSLFLTAPTLKDPTKVKDGHHTLEAFTFSDSEPFDRWLDTTPDERPADYERVKAQLKERMLAGIEMLYPGLTQHVVMAELGTPVTNRRYVAGTTGHMYGTEKTLMQMGPFGFGPTTEIGGLYLAGGSIGLHGVAGATLSGLITAGIMTRQGPGALLSATGQNLRVVPAEHPERWPDALRDKLPATPVAA